ncbi:hypothetical protein SLS55_007994 [Diplodia seriata]|uniref:Uncharacterized protein n=1 Tax=Diplodia seriata TaxID=420778 RepID=A0ABR3CCK3_9PEZI
MAPFLDGGNNPVPDHTVDEDRRQGEFEKLRRDETRASQAELRAERKGDDEKKDVKEPKNELGLAKGQIGFYQEQNEEVESLDTHTSTEGSGKVEIAELIKKLENKQKLIAQISQRVVDDKKKMTELLYQLNRLKETGTPMQKANWESHSKSQEALLVEMAELKKKDRDKQVLIGKIAQKAVDDEKKIADRNKSIQKCKEEVTHLQKEVSDLTHERDELKRQLSTHLPGTEAWTQFARKEL